MKKLIALGLLLMSGLVAVPTAQAQFQTRTRTVVTQDEYNRQDGYNRQRHYRRYDNNQQRYVVNEYRYVRLGHRVYKETYRTTYVRDYRTGQTYANRVLIGRERMSQYDGYNNGRYGSNDNLRFNVFLRF